jgi:hypothetical protein
VKSRIGINYPNMQTSNQSVNQAQSAPTPAVTNTVDPKVSVLHLFQDAIAQQAVLWEHMRRLELAVFDGKEATADEYEELVGHVEGCAAKLSSPDKAKSEVTSHHLDELNTAIQAANAALQ